MNKSLIAIFLFHFSTVSNADWSISSGEVTRVFSHYGANVIRSTISDNVCGAGNFWWPADAIGAKDMFALATSALLSNKKIQVVYNPDTPDCQYGNSAKITHMVLIK